MYYVSILVAINPYIRDIFIIKRCIYYYNLLKIYIESYLIMIQYSNKCSEIKCLSTRLQSHLSKGENQS